MGEAHPRQPLAILGHRRVLPRQPSADLQRIAIRRHRLDGPIDPGHRLGVVLAAVGQVAVEIGRPRIAGEVADQPGQDRLGPLVERVPIGGDGAEIRRVGHRVADDPPQRVGFHVHLDLEVTHLGEHPGQMMVQPGRVRGLAVAPEDLPLDQHRLAVRLDRLLELAGLLVHGAHVVQQDRQRVATLDVPLRPADDPAGPSAGHAGVPPPDRLGRPVGLHCRVEVLAPAVQVADRLMTTRQLVLVHGVGLVVAREDVEGLAIPVERLGPAAQVGVDPRQADVGRGQLARQRRVLGALADERLVIRERRFEQLLAQWLEPGHAEQPVLGDPGQVVVDRPARPAEVLLGLDAHPVGAEPQDGRRGEAAGQDEEQGRDQPRHHRVAAAPSPGPLRPMDPPRQDRLARPISPQVLRQCGGVGIPPRRLLLEALQADRLDVARQARDQPRGGDRLDRLDLLERLQQRGGLERRPAGQQLVQDRAQRIHVRGRSDVPGVAPGLLGRHVAGRAQHRIGLRQPRLDVQRLGQPEVGDLGRAVDLHQDIAGLQVAMDDAQLVRLADAAGQHADHRRGPVRRPGGAVEPGLQAAPFDVLHLVVHAAVAIADVIDLRDVGVMEPGDGLGLRLESDGRVPAGVVAGQDHLQRAQPVEPELPGQVHDPHAAAPQLFEDLVAGHDRPGPLRPGRLPRLGERQCAGRAGVDGLLRLRLAGPGLRVAYPPRRVRSRLARKTAVGDRLLGREADRVAPEGRLGPRPDRIAREGHRRFIRNGSPGPIGLARSGRMAIVALGPGEGIGDGPAAIVETRRPIRGRISAHRPTS